MNGLTVWAGFSWTRIKASGGFVCRWSWISWLGEWQLVFKEVLLRTGLVVHVAISRIAEIYNLESIKNVNICLSTDIVATGVAQFVRTMTGLRARRPGYRGAIPGRVCRCISSPKRLVWLWGQPSRLFDWYRGFFPSEWSSRSDKL